MMTWLFHTWDYGIGWRSPFIQIRCVGFRLFGHEFDHFEIAWDGARGEQRKRVSKTDEHRWVQIRNYKRRLAAR